MKRRLLITEDEKNNIKSLYGLNESSFIEDTINSIMGGIMKGINNDDDKSKDGDDSEYEDELPSHPRHRRLRPHSMKDSHADRLEGMFEGMFTESKVDEVLRGYFKIDQKEKQLLENKKQTQSLIKEERKNKISKIKQISESISQEVASTKLITKYPGAKLVGKTNKHNLVFEMNNKQLRVNTKGEIL